MTTTAHFNLTHPADGAPGQGAVIADDANDIDFLLTATVISRTLTAPPGSPAAGDGYIAKTGVTGWTGTRNGVAAQTFVANDVIYYTGSGWKGWAPEEGWVLAVTAEDIRVAYSGSAWVFQDSYKIATGLSGNLAVQVTATVLGFGISQVTTVTVVTASAVLLPNAEPGGCCTIINASATGTMLVFPSGGDSINALAADASYSLAPGKTATFIAVNTVNWYTILGA